MIFNLFEFPIRSDSPLKILHISPLPPPFGGNSVHVQRLHSRLIEKGFRSMVLDYSGNKKHSEHNIFVLSGTMFQKLLGLLRVTWFLESSVIVHFHVAAMGNFKIFAPVFLIAFFRNRKLMTVHSGSFVSKNKGFFSKIYLRLLLSCLDKVICVSEAQSEYLLGIDVAASKIKVIPAFIPGTINPDYSPNELLGVDKKLILTSGSLTRIYNYDVLIDSIERLDANKYLFVFAFYGEADEEYSKHIMERLRVHSNVVIYNNLLPNQFLAVLKSCDIYIRQTITDGDAVAVREALYFNKIVFATDCVPRPGACFLFQQNSVESLLNLFYEYEKLNLLSEDTKTLDNFSMIVEAYKSLIR